jgi:hypothetical protein
MKKIIAWYICNYGEVFDCLNERMDACTLFETYYQLYTQPIRYIKVGPLTLWICRTSKKYWFEKFIR